PILMYTLFPYTTLFRSLLQLFEYPDIELLFKVKKALREESGFDLLISIAVPHPIHWGTAWAWRKENPIAKTWVADCGDPYMGQTDRKSTRLNSSHVSIS